ncbi:4Fe-4S dicluster domain-containing protein [Candidatus Woesearchaeota archaeon]|nr:4Fe-4S dicluster domain-containing protein [Candidatus Woesearchaeota archaeon]HIH38316.1 hypothetical protein [Candidatus Woesearchaeota archaeon]HIJ03292.1 hypothetical protein [Candidatus Woesearchaeota archaeon]
MAVYVLKKGDLEKFLLFLGKQGELIAPVKKDEVRFEPLKDPTDLYLDEQTYIPAKQYFFPQEQVLFTFQDDMIIPVVAPIKKRIFFGLRRCDLAAIQHQDIAFGEHNDPHYKKLRKSTILIGYQCTKKLHHWCFCGSMDLPDFYDLMFFEQEHHYQIDVGSAQGETLLKKSKLCRKTVVRISKEQKIVPDTNLLQRKDLGKHYSSKAWDSLVKKCISCAACTTLCPTCYCHEIKDDVPVSLKEVQRKRTWSSCQLKEFSGVAGNYTFRESRSSRFKHRIFHQLQYFREKHGVDLCVGCGRCIKHCPPRIDFIKVINKL